jgi:hypothetical protein
MRRPLLLLALVACRTDRPPVVGELQPPVAAASVAAPAQLAEQPPVEPVEPLPAVDRSADDPPLTQPALRFDFLVRPVVGAGPPVLVVTMHNEGARAVPFTRFHDPRCFAHYLLDLRVARRGEPVELSPCADKDWPGVAGELAAGAKEQVTLPLAELARAWPQGSYTIEVRHEPHRLAAAGQPGGDVRASQSAINTGGFAIAAVRKTVKAARDQVVALPGGLRLKFTGNSHKDVHAGEVSPLLIHGAYTPAGGKERTFIVSLHPESSPLLHLGDHVFELVHYDYNEWIEVRYYGMFPDLKY